jgi:hypoxanthine phosphoribosyltransferase
VQQSCAMDHRADDTVGDEAGNGGAADAAGGRPGRSAPRLATAPTTGRDGWDEAAPAPDREVLTWEQFGVASRQLAEIVVADGYRPDVVLAIARGGLTVAGALSYALGVKNCGSMNVEFYTGVDERLDVPVVLPPALDLVDVRGLRVLVADDVADTGHTLRLVREVLEQHVAEARTAVLYRKPGSVVAPDYSWQEVDRWIVFPWSSQPPVED